MLSSNVGTLLYMSHEMLNHEEYGPKTDIWSAGCVLFEIIFLIRFKDFIQDKTNKSFKEYIKVKLCTLLKRMLIKDKCERSSSKDLMNSFQHLNKQTEKDLITYYDFNKNQLPFSILPSRISNFIEKDEILKRINDTYFNKHKQFIIINSCSGTGKTTIATEYAHRFTEHQQKSHYAYMIKSDGPKIELEFETLVKQFKLKKEEKSLINSLKDKLLDLDEDEKILFIFDNCESFLNIERFVLMFTNLKNVFILITTRNEKLIENFNINQRFHLIFIEPFNQEETFQFLRNSLGNKLRNENDLIELANVFGFLNRPIRPILLDKITAFVKLKIGDTIKLRLFLDEIKSSEKNEDEYKSILNQDNYKLFEVLIKKERKAWKILKYISMLDPDCIPMTFFSDILNCDPYEFDTSVRCLRELSLIKIEQTNNDYDDDSIKIHREIQQEAQQYLKTQNITELNEIKRNLFINLKNALQKDNQFKIEKGWNKKRFYYSFKNITDLVETSSSSSSSLDTNEFKGIYYLFGKYLYDFEIDYLESVQYFENALMIQNELNDNDKTDLLSHLGISYARLGKSECLEYLEKSLSIKRTFCSNYSNDLSLADTLNDLALVYNRVNRYNEALKYFQESIEIKEKAFGTYNHSKIASSFSSMGIVYYRLGKYEKALEIYKKSLSIEQEINVNCINLNTAVALNNIGMVQCELGNYMKSLDYFNQSLDICKILYETNEHYRIGVTLTNIAYSYVKVSNFKIVHEYSIQSLEIFSKITENRYVQHGKARAYRNLAYYYLDLKEFNKSLEYSENSLNMFKKLLLNLNSAEILNLIGLAHFYLGQFKQSELSLIESLQIFNNILDNDHNNFMVAQVYESLALIHEHSNENDLALDYRKKANDIRTFLKLKYENY
jgi:tetratricopeptide (TPR) repeat protein